MIIGIWSPPTAASKYQHLHPKVTEAVLVAQCLCFIVFSLLYADLGTTRINYACCTRRRMAILPFWSTRGVKGVAMCKWHKLCVCGVWCVCSESVVCLVFPRSRTCIESILPYSFFCLKWWSEVHNTIGHCQVQQRRLPQPTVTCLQRGIKFAMFKALALDLAVSQ